MNEEFESFLKLQLPVIDEILASDLIDIKQRPLKAAMIMVDKCIVEIRGDTKDDYLDKNWFKHLYQSIGKWYKDRYGAALQKKEDSSIKAIILLYDSPFELKVPLNTYELGEGKTIWVGIPNEVLPDEDVTKWLTSPPNLDKLTPSELRDLKNRIKLIAGFNRTINVNLFSATFDEDGLHNLSHSILSHFSKSSDEILSMKYESISMSFWEIHMALEKTLKLLIRQKGACPPNTHNIPKLVGLAANIIPSFAKSKILEEIPSDKEVIASRYGEGRYKTIQEAFSYYETALSLVSYWSSLLYRKHVMDNAKVLIKPLDLKLNNA